MKPFNGFEAKKSGSREKLPVGGYIAKILNAEIVDDSWGSIVLISFDIAEGEHKDFFKIDYKNQGSEDKKWRGTYRLRIPLDDGSERDGWTKRTFGNAIWAVEDSNPRYRWNWEETTLKDKLVGVLYRNREWEMNGNTGWTTECCAFASVDDIRQGNFKMPKDKPLKEKSSSSAFAPAEEDNEDLPF